MNKYNTRRSVAEAYDPKQRIVGGVVLFLLMLLIYSILKLVLGFSTVPEDEYRLQPAMQDEKLPSMVAAYESRTPKLPNTPTNQRTKRKIQAPAANLPKEFVFLDLDGSPMQPDNYEDVFKSPQEVYSSTEGEKKWYVQAASFKSEVNAQDLAQKIKDKNIASEVHIIESSNGWYAVRLAPETDVELTKEQKKQLRRLLHLRAVIKKIKIK